MPAWVKNLNAILRGWGNYRRHVCARDAFHKVDRYVHEQLWRMLHKRPPRKSKHGCKDRYWKGVGKQQNLAAVGKTTAGKKHYPLVRLGWLGVRRHITIEADANP